MKINLKLPYGTLEFLGLESKNINNVRIYKDNDVFIDISTTDENNHMVEVKTYYLNIKLYKMIKVYINGNLTFINDISTITIYEE